MGKELYNSLQNLQNLCDDGNVDEFKKYCDSLDLKRRQEIVQKKLQDGQTFLIAACKKGYFNLVKYLIDECKADIEQVASVKFDGEQVEGVPPLWCASAAGHLEVVELLVARGAQVNRTTITNSTALRAACFDGHLNVVEFLVNKGADIEIPNRHGHTCLMISCYRGHATIVSFLLEHGARVNRQSAKGNTALHDCAESGNLEGLKLLLKYKAVMKEDEYGMTPIMAGANSGYKNIVEYLANHYSEEIPVKEVAMSYELLGANFLDRHNLPVESKEAWKYALSLYEKGCLQKKTIVPDNDMDWVDAEGDRAQNSLYSDIGFGASQKRHHDDDETISMETDENNVDVNDPEYLKIVLSRPVAQCTSKSSKVHHDFIEELSNERLLKCCQDALGSIQEFTTEYELDQLQEDSDAMKLQTLLIRLRILGPDHPDTIYYIRYRGAIYADSGNIQRCLSLWMYALELQKIYLEPLCHVAQSAFLSFAELFSYILSEQYIALPAVGLDPDLLIDCLELCVDSIDRGIEFSFYKWRNKQNWSYTSADKDASNLFKQTSLCLVFMAMISYHYIQPVSHSTSNAPSLPNQHLKELFTEVMLLRFKKQVYRLVKLDPRLYQGQTLLHLACSRETGQLGRFPICQFPNYQVVRLLLEAGSADPNIADAQGSTPLEILAVNLRKTNSRGPVENIKELMRLLLDNGAHLDVRHRTSSFRNMSYMNLLRFYTENGMNPIKYMTLGCWCQLAWLNAGSATRRNSTIQQTPPNWLPESCKKFLDIHN